MSAIKRSTAAILLFAAYGCSASRDRDPTPAQPQVLRISAHVELQEKLFVIVGQTNLPDDTQMIVGINRPAGQLMGESVAVVDAGTFRSETFSDHGNPYRPGPYDLSVSAGIVDVQPDNAKRKIGPDYANYTGPLVNRSAIGTFADFHQPIYIGDRVR